MQITNKRNLPRSLELAVRSYFSDYDFDATRINAISVTTLLKPPAIRKLWNEHYDELVIDVADCIDMIRGSAIHNILEHAATEDKNLLVEQRFETQYNGYYISGKFDIFDYVTGELLDYKDTSVYKVKSGGNGDIDHHRQLNILKWILDRESTLITKKMTLFYFLKDWQKNQYLKDKENYPDKKWAMIDVGEIDIEPFIAQRLQYHFVNPPEFCNPEERWSVEEEWAVLNQKGTKALPGGKCKTLEEAEEMAKVRKNAGIEYRPAEDKRCENYCSVRQFCVYWQNRKEKGMV